MTKRLFSILVAMLAVVMSYAQSSLVATRTDGITVYAYHGSDALKKALKDAKSGNVITLSSGQFEGATITKNVTLRGMGFRENTKEGEAHGVTVIRTNLTLNIPDTETGKLRLEGLFLKDSLIYSSDIKNAVFEKCRFELIRYYTGGVLDYCTFLHCRIANHIVISPNSNVAFNNSVVYEPYNAECENSHCEFTNCYVDFGLWSNWTGASGASYYAARAVQRSTYRNTIIYSRYSLPKSCSASYCVGSGLSTTGAIFDNIAPNSTNYAYDGGYGPFSRYSWSGNTNRIYSETELFKLSDTAKTKHIGSDGTEIGIHGGSLPYTEDPVRPSILNVSVSKATNSQANLPVIIQVKDANY